MDIENRQQSALSFLQHGLRMPRRTLEEATKTPSLPAATCLTTATWRMMASPDSPSRLIWVLSENWCRSRNDANDWLETDKRVPVLIVCLHWVTISLSKLPVDFLTSSNTFTVQIHQPGAWDCTGPWFSSPKEYYLFLVTCACVPSRSVLSAQSIYTPVLTPSHLLESGPHNPLT